MAEFDGKERDMTTNRRDLVRGYKETPRIAGIYRIRNTATGRLLIGASVDLPGSLNRIRFQLGNGSHPDRELQADWTRYGAQAFEFDELDRLDPKDEPGYDPRPELAALDEMWRETLAASGNVLYARPRGRF
jgi:hypothetical protein